jgi:hypothetical protein
VIAQEIDINKLMYLLKIPSSLDILIWFRFVLVRPTIDTVGWFVFILRSFRN